MATNKKITELTEVELGGIADDDVLVIVDISENETKKVRRSTLRTDLAGVSTLTATSPLAVDAAIGDVMFRSAQFGRVWRSQVRFASFPCGCGRLCVRCFLFTTTTSQRRHQQRGQERQHNDYLRLHLRSPLASPQTSRGLWLL